MTEIKELKNLKNGVSIDWLSLNFKGVDATELLKIFCLAVEHKDISIENFILQERGFVTGYTHSYSYMGTSYIVVSFCPARAEMGVNLQITGQGCKMIYKSDIIEFINKSQELTQDYKCNRLDIAYDDFNGVIPVVEMIDSTRKELDTTNGISTIISRIKRNMMTIYTNHWNGITSENLVFGKHRSARSFRLYDKKLEQKRDDIPYWYRLEIELRTKGKSHNADEAFHKFISGATIFDIFYENIFSMVNFTIDYSENTPSNSNTSSKFWILFQDNLKDELTSHNMYYAKLDMYFSYSFSISASI